MPPTRPMPTSNGISNLAGKTHTARVTPSAVYPWEAGTVTTPFSGKQPIPVRFSDKLSLNSGVKFEYSRFETANKSDDSQNLLIKSSDKDFNLYELYLDIAYYLNHYFSINVGGNYQFYSGETREHTFSPRAKISYTVNKFSIWADYAKTVQYLSLYPYFTVKTPIDIWYPSRKRNPTRHLSPVFHRD